MNGLCGVSRLLGCYYLYPQVIPLPSTKSVTLPPYTNFLLIGTHGLWKYLTQKEIFKCLRSFRDPALCSKRLADLAVAGGCPLDVSVMVVKIVLGEDLVNSKSTPTNLGLDSSIDMIEEAEEEEEEEREEDLMEHETNMMTNIDDLMEESFADSIQPVRDKSYLESAGLKVISPDQLDALVNKDIGVEDLQLVDDILSEEDDDELIREGSYADLEEEEEENEGQGINLRDSIFSGKMEDYNLMEKNLMADQNGDEEESDDASSSDMSDESVSSIEYHSPTNTDQQVRLAKSVPEIKAEYELQLQREDSEVNPVLKNINMAISNVDDDTMSPEEEEQLRKGGSVKRKKSFVQSSYDRLSRHAFDTGTSFHSL